MLQINYTKGKYELRGSLELENSKSLLSYFNTLLKYDSKIVLSLKNLKTIDTSGIEALKELYKTAATHNKRVKIFRKVNEKIVWILNEPKLKGIIK